MKKTASELIKRLKAIKNEIDEIENDNLYNSTIEVDLDNKNIRESDYSYDNNNKRINELYDEEFKIRSILGKFNTSTIVEDTKYTISECLVKISQLRNMINHRQTMIRKNNSIEPMHSGDILYYVKPIFNPNVIKEEIKTLSEELSRLQILVDKTNLTTEIDCC